MSRSQDRAQTTDPARVAGTSGTDAPGDALAQPAQANGLVILAGPDGSSCTDGACALPS